MGHIMEVSRNMQWTLVIRGEAGGRLLFTCRPLGWRLVGRSWKYKPLTVKYKVSKDTNQKTGETFFLEEPPKNYMHLHL